MYWQDRYQTPGHAARALELAARGKIVMTPSDLHVAHVAVRSGMSGLSEDPNNLGSLKSVLKKVVKTASKLSPSHQIAKKLKITKFSPSHILAEKLSKSSPKQAPARVAEAPATSVLPNAPAQPIPELPAPTSQVPISFAQGSSGGGGFSPAPAPVATEESSGLSLPVMIGIGAGALLLLYLLMRKR